MKQSINITMQGQPSKIKKLFSHTEFIILLATVVLMLASYFVNNAFFSQYNMSTLLRQMSFVTIVAFGQTMILILGDIDLSVGDYGGYSHGVARAAASINICIMYCAGGPLRTV